MVDNDLVAKALVEMSNGEAVDWLYELVKSTELKPSTLADLAKHVPCYINHGTRNTCRKCDV